jgi:hypothetical protein
LTCVNVFLKHCFLPLLIASVIWRIKTKIHKTKTTTTTTVRKISKAYLHNIKMYSHFLHQCNKWRFTHGDKSSCYYMGRDLNAQISILTIYITVFVTRGRHFGAQESVWSFFSRRRREKNISKTDSQGPQNDSRNDSQKQCWIKLYLTFGSKMDQY